jgi:hypothetical protein
MNAEAAKWRRAVMIRDKRHCRLCLAAKRLEAHHIYPFGAYPARRWDVANGITLCRTCHYKFLRRELEFAEIFTFITSLPVRVLGAEPLALRAEWQLIAPDLNRTVAGIEVKLDNTAPSNLVLDFFFGSGNLEIEALKHDRRYGGIKLNLNGVELAKPGLGLSLVPPPGSQLRSQPSTSPSGPPCSPL